MLTALKGKRLFYGWIIVAAFFLVTFVTFGVQYSFGVFLKPLQDEFGWTRTMISGIPALHTFFMSIFVFVGGWFTDRYGSKSIVGIGGICIGSGLMLVSHISAPWQMYIYYSLMVGAGAGCAGVAGIGATVSRWFAERRGLALGIVLAGTGLGTSIMGPLASYLISTYSWRTSYLILGFAALAIIVIAALLLKKQPGEIDALPYGRTHGQAKDDQPPELEGLTMSQALRTRAFWLLSLLALFIFMALMMVTTHLVAHAEDVGISRMTAGTFLSVIGVASIVGRISVGIASDRFGRKPLYILSLLLQAITILWLIKLTSVWMFYLFAAVWGFSWGGLPVMFLAIIGDLFGLRHVGSILGLASLSAAIGGVVGPTLAGYVFDATGSYSIAFSAAAVLMFSSAMIVPFLRVSKIG